MSVQSHQSVAPLQFASDADRVESFGECLDALRREVEEQLGAEDLEHILHIGRLSLALEIAGRGLIHCSVEPLGFSLGVGALSIHKALELMEIGHMALHGCFDKLEGAERYHSKSFRWKAPIDEASWRRGHNIRHHQYTNIEGRDPDLTFGALRLSARVPRLPSHALQPLTNLVTWLGFANGINLHVTGMLDLYLHHTGASSLPDRKPETVLAAKRAFAGKFLRYHFREYVVFPALAGPFFWKVALGNALSEMGRDVWAGAVIYSGHVGARDYPRGTKARGRAQWYRMQTESARNLRVSKPISILCGALDRQIEHHLFPKLPPNRLREISPRVKAICEAHGVKYLEKDWPSTLVEVFGELRRLSTRSAAA